ncbi:MAG: type II toxin-antitoxin system VapC family toxin [Betaproteobacteria bacterium]|jgi:predicted nucleic-acid-binding protein
MKVTVDTNVLIRAVIRDDAKQAKKAIKILGEATFVVITLSSLCEFVWVLLRSYDIEALDISKALKALISATNVEVNRPAVEAGISQLEAGGDFADAVIAYEGKWLGGETFVSFDKKAISLLKKQNQSAELL